MLIVWGTYPPNPLRCVEVVLPCRLAVLVVIVGAAAFGYGAFGVQTVAAISRGGHGRR